MYKNVPRCRYFESRATTDLLPVDSDTKQKAEGLPLWKPLSFFFCLFGRHHIRWPHHGQEILFRKSNCGTRGIILLRYVAGFGAMR